MHQDHHQIKKQSKTKPMNLIPPPQKQYTTKLTKEKNCLKTIVPSVVAPII